MPNPGPRYSICGASYFNEVFGAGGELELTHGYTGEAVLTHNKTSYGKADYTWAKKTAEEMMKDMEKEKEGSQPQQHGGGPQHVLVTRPRD